MKEPFLELEKKLKVKFNNLDYLKEALTHRSYLNENKLWPYHHNERLEFLGDAVLELIISEYLFKKYPDFQEGQLTALRANLANTSSLIETAKKLEIKKYLLLSKGEAKSLLDNSPLLANAVEAIIGAIYLDMGYLKVREFIEENILYKTEKILSSKSLKDPKSIFQEISQEKFGITPSYKTLSSWGPDHNKRFEVGVFLNEELIAKGEGSSKQEAAQKAAEEALKKKGWIEN